MPDPVIKTIDVPCPQDKAFAIFTSDFSIWWPRDKHSVSAMGGSPAKSVHLEPKSGGQISEIGHDGTTHIWGSVRVYDPSDRLSLLWHIGKPVAEATHVDVTFEPREGGTRVTLTHHGWDALGDDGPRMRGGYNTGWVHVFETCFANACKTGVDA